MNDEVVESENVNRTGNQILGNIIQSFGQNIIQSLRKFKWFLSYQITVEVKI